MFEVWRDLLKSKVQEIAEQQIAVKDETAETSADGESQGAAEATDQQEDDGESRVETEQAEERKQQLAESILELREEQAHLIERLTLVVDALESKGGEVESYRQYVSAISGIELDVTDTATTWTVVKGWLELVLDDPAPVVQLNELGDSAMNFICRPWTKTSDYWTVCWDITRAVKDEFDRNGISIPFPQRDIHVYQESTAAREHAIERK
jgi:small-conductance mechanosensitive channel